MGHSDPSPRLSQPLRSDVLRKDAGYWTIHDLAAYLQVSKWTAKRRVKADKSFPVLKGWGADGAGGADRYPVERVKAYLQRLEQGRGKAYQKSADLLHLASTPRVNGGAAAPEQAP